MCIVLPVDGANHNERGLIDTLRQMAKKDRYLTDSSVLEALKQFCILYPLVSASIVGIPLGSSFRSQSIKVNAAAATRKCERNGSVRTTVRDSFVA